MDPVMELIEAYRKKKKLRCKEIAFKIGILPCAYSRFRNGKRKLTNNFRVRAFTRLKEIQQEIAQKL
jgi:transcriptional regulator with XRE-family HTH domain